MRDAICFAFRLNEHNNNNNGQKRGSNSGQFMEESGTIGREDAETPVPPSTVWGFALLKAHKMLNSAPNTDVPRPG